MLAEVFGAVFSRHGVKSSLWLALMALIFVLVGTAVTVPWLLAMGLPFDRFRPLALTNTGLFFGSLLAILVALFFVGSYAHVAIIGLARQLRAGQAADFGGALKGKGEVVLSYAGSYFLFLLVQGVVVVVILAAIISAFVLGTGAPRAGIPGSGPPVPFIPTGVPRIQGASPFPFDFTAPPTPALPAAAIGLVVLLAIGLIVWMVFFTVKLTFFRYAVVVDGERAVSALKTSWRLTKGRWWSLFGTFFLLGLVLAVLALVAALVIALPVGILTGGILAILVFGVAFYFAFELIWYLLAVPVLFYAGLAAYEELKRAAPATSATAAPPAPPTPA